MPTRGYVDPNMALAGQLGESIAGLFAARRPNYAAKSKYALEASMRNENDALARKANADAEGTEYTTEVRRGLADSFNGYAGMDAQQQKQRGLALAMGGDASQVMDAVNAGYGGAMMMEPSAAEGRVRTGYALTGQDAAVNNPLTQGGVSDLFGQQTSLQDSKNKATTDSAGIRAGATLGAARIRAGATIQAAHIRGARSRGGAGKPPKPEKISNITPDMAQSLGKMLDSRLPAVSAGMKNGKPIRVPAQMDPQLRADVIGLAGRIYQADGDANRAVEQALLAYTNRKGGQDFVPGNDGGWFGGAVPATPSRPVTYTRRQVPKGTVPSVRTQRGLQMLPSGTEFIGPDGVRRVKK